MVCNTAKCKEFVVRKKSNNSIYPIRFNIKQFDHLTLLGVTFQSNCKLSGHFKAKLCQANKCLFLIRGLRKECYGQEDLVLSKLTYSLLNYGASKADLYIVERFLKRCHKRHYISHELSIYDLLEKSDRMLYSKISGDEHHPLYSILPTVKDSSLMLRRKTPQLPSVNTERFKNCFVNRL